jgi:glycosyltransferase involved in cell wall biosynthesis
MSVDRVRIPVSGMPTPARFNRMSDDRLRVLMLVDRLRRGGAERLLVGLATHLPRDRFDVVVCTTRAGHGQLLEDLHAAGIEHLPFDRRHRFDLAPLLRLARLVRARRFHVLHAHKFGANVWGTILGRLSRVPVVMAHEHTWSYEGQPLRRFLDGQLIGRLAHAFVAVSKRDRDRMIAIEGVPPEKIVVMPTAFVPRAANGSGDLRNRLGIPSGATVIGTAAVLRPQKALHVLVEAFARLASSHPDAHLVVAGTGPCGAPIEALARERGVADRVHLLGWIEDVAGLLKASDIAAISSDFEGTPLFALECMAHGVPLVSTDVGGIADVLEDGRSVLLVPRRDPEALAGALTALLDDTERRQALASAAAERLHPLRIEQVAADFAGLYERLSVNPSYPYAGAG